MSAPSGQVDVLTELRSESQTSLDRLVSLVYDELRRIAHRHIAVRGGGDTLQTTGLVHETYLRLVDQSRAQPSDRAHFLALASLAMRHILVDRAKARRRLKRGGDARPVTFDEGRIAADDQPEALLQLDEALERVAETHPRLTQVVECRFFGGLTEEETAGLRERLATAQNDQSDI